MKLTVCDFCESKETINLTIGKTSFDICSLCMRKLTLYCFDKHKKNCTKYLSAENFFSPIRGLQISEIKHLITILLKKGIEYGIPQRTSNN